MTELFICPKCDGALKCVDGKSLVCDNGHNYDISRQGYVNLVLGNGSGSGDDKEMCRSRHEFHSGDYYSCLSDTIADFCLKHHFKTILDAGCGEGYYLRKIKNVYEKNGTSGAKLCGLDLAKEAISIAAKCEKMSESQDRIKYAVSGIFDMPVENESFDCVLSVFAPVPDAEAYRILKCGGCLVVASPGAKHLEGLKNAVYSSVYDNECEEKEYKGFLKEDVIIAEDMITVDGNNILNLFRMTPYYWKTSEKDASKLTGLDSLSTKIEFIITIYKKI